MELDLNTVWFVIVLALLAGYAILDGFDLGVGAWHLFARKDEDRRVLLNSIGPVWDGNQVWLVTGGGALFAAFPEVYATVFSGFYLAFMVVLFALIFRAVSIKFRSKETWPAWRSFWDTAFCISSIVASIIFGVALGNIIRGIPLDDRFEYLGTFFDLLNPFSVLVGITTLALFMMHGALFLVLKTDGDLQQQARNWSRYGIIFFISSYTLTVISAFLFLPHIASRYMENPPALIFPGITFVLAFCVPYIFHRGKSGAAFVASCATILSTLLFFAVSMFPNIVNSSLDPLNSLNIYNSASTKKTLGTMLTIAIIGMPLALAYTVYVYRVFRGKIKLDSISY